MNVLTIQTIISLTETFITKVVIKLQLGQCYDEKRSLPVLDVIFYHMLENLLNAQKLHLNIYICIILFVRRLICLIVETDSFYKRKCIHEFKQIVTLFLFILIKHSNFVLRVQKQIKHCRKIHFHTNIIVITPNGFPNSQHRNMLFIENLLKNKKKILFFCFVFVFQIKNSVINVYRQIGNFLDPKYTYIVEISVEK